MTSANQAGPKSSATLDLAHWKGRHFLLRPRRRASVSCARNNRCSSEEASWSRTINDLFCLDCSVEKWGPAFNLAEDQQSGAGLKSLNSDLSAGKHPQRALWLCHIHAAVCGAVVRRVREFSRGGLGSSLIQKHALFFNCILKYYIFIMCPSNQLV